MGMKEERAALEQADWLPSGVVPELCLWGIIQGGRLEMREGLLFIADQWWGFYGRDFEHLTPYAGFVGEVWKLDYVAGPLPSNVEELGIYRLEGEIPEDGLLGFQFVPDAESYRHDPETVDLFFATLQIRMTNQVHPDAIGVFEQGLAHWEAGHFEDAQELMWRAYRVDQRSALLPFHLAQMLSESNPSKALELLDEAKQRSYFDQQEWGLLKTRVRINLGQLRLAAREAQAVLTKEEHPEAHVLLAEIEFIQGREHEALIHYKQAANLNPQDGRCQALLAYQAARLGLWDIAERALPQAQQWETEESALWLAEALILKHRGEDEQAIQIVEELLELRPGFPVAIELLMEWGVYLPPQEQPAELYQGEALDPSTLLSLAQQEPTALLRQESAPVNMIGPAVLQQNEPTRLLAPEPTTMLRHEPTAMLEQERSSLRSLQGQLEQLKLEVVAALRGLLPEIREGVVLQLELFAREWGTHLSLPPNSDDEEYRLLVSMQNAFAQILDEQIPQLLTIIEPVIQNKQALAVATLPGLAATLSCSHMQTLAEGLENSCWRVCDYGMGLIEGGLFSILMEDLSQGLLPEAGKTVTNELQDQLSLLVRRFDFHLESWQGRAWPLFESQIEQLQSILCAEEATMQAAMAEAVPPSAPSMLSKTPAQDLNAVSHYLQESTSEIPEEIRAQLDLPPGLVETITENSASSIPAAAFAPPSSKAPPPNSTPHAYMAYTKSKRNGAQTVPSSAAATPSVSQIPEDLSNVEPAALQRAARLSSVQNNNIRTDATSLAVRRPRAGKSSTAKSQFAGQQLSSQLLQRSLSGLNPSSKEEEKQDENQIEKLYKEYMAACHMVGSEDAPPKERFLLFMQKRIRQFEAKTGKKANFYVRIEDGKPQIKIHEQE